MARHLFIVARQESELFSYLAREFSAEPDVTVIVDRRRGERRRAPRSAPDDRRQKRDRRLKADIVRELSTLGYAFVRLS